MTFIETFSLFHRFAGRMDPPIVVPSSIPSSGGNGNTLLSVRSVVSGAESVENGVF
jgi:hypothetical protein